MYADGTFLTTYCRNYIKREKKIKAGRRILAAGMAVLVAGASVFATVKLSFADERIDSITEASEDEISTTETSERKLSVKINSSAVAASYMLSQNIISESVSFEKLVSENVTQASVLVEAAKPPVIFIDAGHGGADGGCEGGKVLEKNVNLEIAKVVKERLENRGYKVIMSREDDTYVSKEDRVKAANSSGADIFVSIHQNTSKYSKVKGMEVWYDGTDTGRDNERLAQLIKEHTIDTTASIERELKENADFYVTGHTTMPACLIETGFLSNSTERKNLTSAEYQEKIADGIAKGIECYFNPI